MSTVEGCLMASCTLGNDSQFLYRPPETLRSQEVPLQDSCKGGGGVDVAHLYSNETDFTCLPFCIPHRLAPHMDVLCAHDQ